MSLKKRNLGILHSSGLFLNFEWSIAALGQLVGCEKRNINYNK